MRPQTKALSRSGKAPAPAQRPLGAEERGQQKHQPPPIPGGAFAVLDELRLQIAKLTLRQRLAWPGGKPATGGRGEGLQQFVIRPGRCQLPLIRDHVNKLTREHVFVAGLCQVHDQPVRSRLFGHK